MGTVTWINAHTPSPLLHFTWMVAYWNDLNTGHATCSGECGIAYMNRNEDFDIDWEIADGEDDINCCIVCEKVYE